jgi:hypothetical protein
VVIITHYTTAASCISSLEGPFRSHILLSIEPNTIIFNTAYRDKVTIHPRLAILLLEHESAPAFHLPAIRQDLPEPVDNFLLLEANWLAGIDTTTAPHSHERRVAADFPGLELVYSEPLYLERPLKPDRANDMPSLDCYTTIPDTDILITMLGHPPNRLITHLLKNAGHDESTTTPDKQAYIRACLLSTLQKAHKRSRHRRLRKKHGAQEILAIVT